MQDTKVKRGEQPAEGGTYVGLATQPFLVLGLQVVGCHVQVGLIILIKLLPL